MKKHSINNKGFSLIELIVVVLIMAIISGGAIWAIGSVFSTQAKAAGKSVADAMKQVRIYALGRENKTVGDETEVFAKFYKKGKTLYVDICEMVDGYIEQDDGTKVPGSVEHVIREQQISGVNYNVEFYKRGASSPEFVVDSEETAVNVYFKKATGGISGVWKSKPNKEKLNNIDEIRVVRDSDSNNYAKLILVRLTGRVYVDEEG